MVDILKERTIELDLDAAFGSLDEPLTDYEIDSGDEKDVNKDLTRNLLRKKRRGRGHSEASIIRGVQQRAKTLARIAQRRTNTKIFENFNFSKATNETLTVRRKHQEWLTAPRERTVWGEDDKDSPRRAMSANGYDLVYHFPGGISHKAKEVLTDLLIDYGKALDIKVTPTADKFHRNNPNSYVEKKGEVAGVVHLVRCWHGIGRPDLDMVISHDFTKSGIAFSKSLELLTELQLFSQGINSFLKNIDPI
ncbi:hypothetical protein F5050DRAFT_1813386 [Lentinula boryana]|uniref:Uncharacterized protein n=1 Tax=Lentinula boryana TaxID=40481 RepID=A0ABQ8PWP7_9AGAR|nr:hypothetical protein F5050DRAFT_1813386 [Lentinula boryana]